MTQDVKQRGIIYMTKQPVSSHDSPLPPCDCDSPGGVKTLRDQVCLPLNGKVCCIDRCIHQIVAALNAGGISTVASCCGHGKMPGRIDLEDGRTLAIIATDAAYPVWQAFEQ